MLLTNDKISDVHHLKITSISDFGENYDTKKKRSLNQFAITQ